MLELTFISWTCLGHRIHLHLSGVSWTPNSVAFLGRDKAHRMDAEAMEHGPVMTNLSSQATVEDIEVCESSASSGVEVIGQPRPNVVDESMEHDAQRHEIDDSMENAQRHDT